MTSASAETTLDSEPVNATRLPDLLLTTSLLISAYGQLPGKKRTQDDIKALATSLSGARATMQQAANGQLVFGESRANSEKLGQLPEIIQATASFTASGDFIAKIPELAAEMRESVNDRINAALDRIIAHPDELAPALSSIASALYAAKQKGSETAHDDAVVELSPDERSQMIGALNQYRALFMGGNPTVKQLRTAKDAFANTEGSCVNRALGHAQVNDYLQLEPQLRGIVNFCKEEFGDGITTERTR